ncbi:hypothetical protein PMAYCL1PPCAC_06198, partial [Pristionchus mayeri]
MVAALVLPGATVPLCGSSLKIVSSELTTLNATNFVSELFLIVTAISADFAFDHSHIMTLLTIVLDGGCLGVARGHSPAVRIQLEDRVVGADDLECYEFRLGIVLDRYGDFSR